MLDIKQLEKSQIEITGELSAEEFKNFWSKAVERLSREVKVDGFRPGHVPEDVILKNVGQVAILDTAAELALQANYPKIIFENKIEAIGRPMISITKIAKDNPLGFRIVVAIIPQVVLPDYKQIAANVLKEGADKKIEVTEKEVDDLIEELRRQRARVESAVKRENEQGPVDGGVMVGGSQTSETKTEEMPLFNDEFVKGLGDFKDVADFREKMKANLKAEKEFAAKENMRFKIIEEIDGKSQMTVPDILVENELNRGIAQMRAEIEREGLDFDDYLKSIKKTTDEIRSESEKKAEKNVRFNLILKNIAKNEMISISDNEVTKEAEKLIKLYEGADLEAAKAYVLDIMTNNKVFKLLEGQGQSSS